MKKRYWLHVRNSVWQEVTRGQFVRAERSSGFISRADSFFSNGTVSGQVTRGEITREIYGLDPDFFKVATSRRLRSLPKRKNRISFNKLQREAKSLVATLESPFPGLTIWEKLLHKRLKKLHSLISMALGK